jgi:UTP--glucose-1-phosphate uridylyltransferase
MSLIQKVVITSAGLGTRLLPMSKELPKEMMPVFMRGPNGIVLKPLLQALFEQLHTCGFREFCFVVGRGKRAIEDHFTPDWSYIEFLEKTDKAAIAEELRAFYKIVEESTIMWVNQPAPKGFGHAISMARSFVGESPFLAAAGDTYITTNSFITRMLNKFNVEKPKAVLLLQHVLDPRHYGVATVSGDKVLNVVEKPSIPPSDLAIMPIYIFDPVIMKKLSHLPAGYGGEIQLTDAIQRIIRIGEVKAVLLSDNEYRLDLGTPENYWEAIRTSYKVSGGKGNPN